MTGKSKWKNKNRDILKGVNKLITTPSSLVTDVVEGAKDLIITPIKKIKKKILKGKK